MLENTTTKVADDIVGRCDYYVDEQHTGDHPSYDPTKMDPTDFYVEYRGVLASKDTGPWQFDKIVKKESPTDNLHIFYFKYDKEFWYKTVYQYAGTDGQYHQFKAIDWQKSGEDHSGHEIAQTVDAGDAFINNPVGDDGKTYPVHLVSTRTVTKNLLADGEAGHPDDNIFYFNYAMNDDVKFIYKTATFAKAQYGNPELTYNGGSVNPQEQTVAVILPDGQFSSSTATAFNGFKFVGWYPMGADGKIDLSKPAITTDNIINAPKNTDGFYMEGATYFAAFEYDANITINYNVRAAKSIDAAGNPQDEITPAPTGTTLTPASETNTPVGYTFTGTVADPIAGGFYAYRWVDSQGNVVKAAGQTDMNKFVPSAVDSGHGYSYYEQETYTL
ncbi:MAG: hypothetical protein Q4F54_00270 [Coriobacteriia bacterium]|nr:hypothetical protein [Coriobacteriia bacterium]